MRSSVLLLWVGTFILAAAKPTQQSGGRTNSCPRARVSLLALIFRAARRPFTLRRTRVHVALVGQGPGSVCLNETDRSAGDSDVRDIYICVIALYIYLMRLSETLPAKNSLIMTSIEAVTKIDAVVDVFAPEFQLGAE